MSTLVSVQGVDFAINGTRILHNIDLSISEKEIVTIVGPNGAGKSTLVSIILRLQKPSFGTVSYAHNVRTAYVPQSINRDATMPVSVMDFLRLAKTAPKKQHVAELLNELSLIEHSQSLIHHLSGGELRRVLFARALLNSPDLLVLDEPTAGIDVVGQEHFYHQLNELRERYHFAILMVSHDLHLVMSTTDRVICLNQHICCQGTPSYVLKNPQYQELFGSHVEGSERVVQLPSELALYEHHHTHEH